MGAKWIKSERPRSGSDWLGNASVSEQNRISCLRAAQIAEDKGELELAGRMREYAAQHRRDRDRIQREEEHRAMNRSLRFGRRRY
jgi:hypothetical protein